MGAAAAVPLLPKIAPLSSSGTLLSVQEFAFPACVCTGDVLEVTHRFVSDSKLVTEVVQSFECNSVKQYIGSRMLRRHDGSHYLELVETLEKS